MKYLPVFILFLFPGHASAQNDTIRPVVTDSIAIVVQEVKKPFMLIKPESSIGYSTFNGGSLNWQVGGSVMLYANKTQRYGITVNYISIDYGNIEYVSTGIVLEMVMWKYLYARVGTVGYLGIRNATHAFGITSNIGFEYSYKFFVLSGGYKADAIIIDKLPSNNNFYVQASFRIDRKVKNRKK